MDKSAPQSIRVLLVSASEATRGVVADILQRWSAGARLYWAPQAGVALPRAQDVLPHVILVDDDLAGFDAVALIRQLTARVPGSVVVALVRLEDMARASQAVLAGARAFLVKPLQPEEVATTLRQVLAQAGQAEEGAPPTEQLGQVVVFCAPKGGTGRTTLAVNTALSLHQAAGEDVALVDADFAAPAIDVALNLPADHSIADLLPRLAQLDADLISSIMDRHASGVDVLLAPPPADLSQPISLPQVEQILVWLRAMYSWVVVDLGLPMDDTAFAFLDGADRIVVSVLPEMIGLRNTRLLVDLLRERGYAEEHIWLVLNRANMRGGIPAEEIEGRLRLRVHSTIPDDQPLVTHSVNTGVPVVLSHPKSPLGRAFGGLARALIESVEAERQPERGAEAVRGGVLSRLFGNTTSS